jgi:PAS domain S-box-containing protein
MNNSEKNKIEQPTEASRENEVLHHSLISKLPDLVLVHIDGKIVFVNDAVISMSGYKPEDVIGKIIFDFLPLEESDKMREINQRRYSHETLPDIYETKIVHKNGTSLDVEVRVLTIDYDGREARLVVLTDVSQRKKLVAVEERFRNLADLLPETIYETDMQGKLTYVNSTGLKKFGYDLNDLKRGFNIRNLFSDQEFVKVIDSRNKTINDNNIRPTEFVAKKKDGSEFPVIFHTVPIIENSRAVGTRGVVIDITERKLAETALLTNQKRLETLLTISQMSSASLTDMICFLLDSGINLMASPILFIAIIDEKNGMMSLFSRRKNGKDVLSGEHRFSAKEVSEWRQLFHDRNPLIMNEIDQSKFPVLPEPFNPVKRQIIMPLFDENNFMAMAGIGDKNEPYVSSDILQLNLLMGEFGRIINHRFHENAIRTEREKLRVTLRSIVDGMISTDHEGSITLMNHAAEKITGWMAADVKDKKLDDFFILQYDDSEIFAPSLLGSLSFSEREPLFFNEISLIQKNGTKVPIEANVSPLIDRDNTISGAVIVFRDVTEKKRIEEIRLRSIKLESVGILAGGIAHDFNNILTSILGNISLARNLINETDEIYDLLLAAEKSSNRAKGLSQQLLTLSKGGEPVKSKSSIADLIRDCVSLTIRGSNVNCEFDIPEGFPPVEIDEGQIQQVLNNLIINAMQAMPKGGTIKISGQVISFPLVNRYFLEAGTYVMISITDSGIGIAPGNLSRIFDPYFTTKTEGHGLGLATTFSIISKHNGHIEAESSPEKTTFTFYLPAKKGLVQSSTITPVGENIKKGKILILEDESSIIAFLEKFFEKNGYTFVITSDGKDTVTEYQTAMDNGKPFDVVLLDLTIPGGTGGKEVISILRKINPEVKAIVCSGYSNDSMIANYLDHGFSERIIKPYHVEDLRSILGKVLSAK